MKQRGERKKRKEPSTELAQKLAQLESSLTRCADWSWVPLLKDASFLLPHPAEAQVQLPPALQGFRASPLYPGDLRFIFRNASPSPTLHLHERTIYTSMS